jgi:hypothetical protein
MLNYLGGVEFADALVGDGLVSRGRTGDETSDVVLEDGLIRGEDTVLVGSLKNTSTKIKTLTPPPNLARNQFY